MDYRNSLKTTLYTTTGISLGAIITLIAAVFTQAIITFWFYLFIPIILVILYLIFFQIKLNYRIEKTDNYGNYIQVLLRKSTTQATPDKINQFIPFSFTFEYIKTKDQSLNECLREFNQANPSDYLEDYLEDKEIPRKISIPWSVIIQSTVIVIIITITVVFQIYYSYSRPTLGLIEQLIIVISIIISIGAYILGRLRSIKDQLNKRRLKQFFGKSANNPDRIKLIIPVLYPREGLDVIAVADIQAAACLTSLLEPLTPQAIEPITREDSLDDVDMCLICIGSPLSNSKAKLLMEDVDQSVVSWVKTSKDQYHQLLRVNGVDDFISTQTEDYGLILKIESKSSKRDFAFLIAGITPFGTIGAARYLKKKWKNLNNKADRKPFICVIQVEKKNTERIKEVYFKIIVK